jgi:hypothetical protein
MTRIKYTKVNCFLQGKLKVQQKGMALLEVGLFIVITAVLAGGYLVNMRAVAPNGSKLGAIVLTNVEQAVKTFVLKQGRLPCPDLTGSGWEGDNQGKCPVGRVVGDIPFASLGLNHVPVSGVHMRLGIWRSNEADLVHPENTSVSSVSNAQSPMQLLKASALESAKDVDTKDQPYIARKDSQGNLTDCSVTPIQSTGISHPAFVVNMIANTSDPDVLNDKCFASLAGIKSSVVSVGRLEFLSWLQDYAHD